MTARTTQFANCLADAERYPLAVAATSPTQNQEAELADTDTLERSTSIAVIVESNPSIVLLDTNAKDDLFNHIRSEMDAFEPNTSTAKGREAIRKFSSKITRTKTAIDAAGKALNEDARAKINLVDAARREAKTELSAMADAVRKPLTDWEEAEELRVKECRDTIQHLKSAMNVYMDDTADAVRARGMQIFETELDADKFRDMLAEAQEAKAATIESLKASLARLVKEEADRAELARLQAAEVERQAKEEQEREAEAQRQREQQEAAERERQRVDYVKAIIQHIRDCGNGMIGGKAYPFPILLHELESKVVIDESFGDLEAEARQVLAENLEKLNDAFQRHMKKGEEEHAAQVQREAEMQAAKLATEMSEKKQRQHDEALAAERQRAQEAEQREADRIAKEKQEAAQLAIRQTDAAHRTAVKIAARDALVACGVNAKTAEKVVLAILAGDIPAVRLEF